MKSKRETSAVVIDDKEKTRTQHVRALRGKYAHIRTSSENFARRKHRETDPKEPLVQEDVGITPKFREELRALSLKERLRRIQGRFRFVPTSSDAFARRKQIEIKLER